MESSTIGIISPYNNNFHPVVAANDYLSKQSHDIKNLIIDNTPSVSALAWINSSIENRKKQSKNNKKNDDLDQDLDLDIQIVAFTSDETINNKKYSSYRRSHWEGWTLHPP